MKKQIVVLFALLSLGTSAWAQKEYRLAKSTGRLNLNISGAVVEGYNGNEIIFSSQKKVEEVTDERAKGLKAINGAGFTDNTGLGIDVSVNGQDINVNTVNNRPDGILSIKVPQNMKISFSNNNVIYSGEVILRNLNNEIEVSATYNKIRLENNSGPMNIKTVYGSVDASFTGDIKGPVSIISVYNYVDVSLPAATKANIDLGTSYGKLYAADQFKIVLDAKNDTEEKSGSSSRSIYVNGKKIERGLVNNKKSEDDESSSASAVNTGSGVIVRAYGRYREGENIKGKINGGGVDLILKSNYKNVYLRQK